MPQQAALNGGESPLAPGQHAGPREMVVEEAAAQGKPQGAGPLDGGPAKAHFPGSVAEPHSATEPIQGGVVRARPHE